MRGTAVLAVAIILVVIGVFFLLVPASFGSRAPAAVTPGDFEPVSGPSGSFEVATVEVPLASTPYGLGSDSVSVTWSVTGHGQSVTAGLYLPAQRQAVVLGNTGTALATDSNAGTSGKLSTSSVASGQSVYVLFFLPNGQSDTNLTVSWTGVESLPYGVVGATVLVLGLLLFAAGLILGRPHPASKVPSPGHEESFAHPSPEPVMDVPPAPYVVPIHTPPPAAVPPVVEPMSLPPAAVAPVQPRPVDEEPVLSVPEPLVGPAPSLGRCSQCGSAMADATAPCRMCGHVPEPPPVAPAVAPSPAPAVAPAPTVTSSPQVTPSSVAPSSPTSAPTPAVKATSPSFVAGPGGSPRGLLLPSAHEEMQRRCPSCRLGIPEESWYFCPRCGTEIPEGG